MRKFLCSTLAIFLFCMAGASQGISLNSASSNFSEILGKAVADFRYNFVNIQGASAGKEGNVDTYESSILLPGASQTLIYRFNSDNDTSASWQATMFRGETYAEALKAYRNTIRLLNKCRLRFPGDLTVGFSGKFVEPDPNIMFANSAFRLNTSEPAYARFFAEIEMLNTGFDSWEVHLSLHNRKPDVDRY